MNRNFDAFELNHWYIYTGTKREDHWNNYGEMDFVLNHNPVKCSSSSRTEASFNGGRA